ncbi:7037_t:CDS:1, partial [Cetraspora pellucida]
NLIVEKKKKKEIIVKNLTEFLRKKHTELTELTELTDSNSEKKLNNQ